MALIKKERGTKAKQYHDFTTVLARVHSETDGISYVLAEQYECDFYGGEYECYTYQIYEVHGWDYCGGKVSQWFPRGKEYNRLGWAQKAFAKFCKDNNLAVA